jgi:PmbA protein
VNEKKEYMDLVQSAVERAKKIGADGAEAFVSDTQSVQISVSGRQVEQVSAVQEAGIGLRLLKDKKMVFGSTNDLSPAAVQSLIEDLIKKVPFHTHDEYNGIAGRENGSLDRDWASYREITSYDPQVADTAVEEKIKVALRIEAAGLGFSPKISGAMMTVYQDGTHYTYLANSNGVSGWFPSSGCGGGAEMSAAQGEDHQSGSYFNAYARYSEFNPDDLGRKAAEDAVRMLGAKPIGSCEIPMVVHPRVGADLFSFLAQMLSADEVQKGRSLFAGKIGVQVAAKSFNLIDDGLLKGGLSTAPVDAEGVPQQTTPLIVEGVLKGYLYDSYTARKGKTKSTGNRSRGGFGSSGGVGTTNLYMQPGKSKPEEIFGGIRRGFYLTQAIGMFAGIHTASGDFSMPVAGMMIENGKLIFPVRGVSIGGNLFEFLKSIDKVGNDLNWQEATGCPTFSVSSIKIGGVKGA